jgi:peptidoglycan-associated lipoprotein
MKMRKSIIFLCLVIFVLAFAGCTQKQLTKGDGTSSAESASAEQTMREETASQNSSGLNDIHFDFDRSNLRPEDKQILSGHAKYLKNNKKVKIVIEGNCDERGTAKYNLALGDRRAREAKQYLVNSGVDSKRIKTISYGKGRPIDSEHNEEAWAKNRRDHFVIN